MDHNIDEISLYYEQHGEKTFEHKKGIPMMMSREGKHQKEKNSLAEYENLDI